MYIHIYFQYAGDCMCREGFCGPNCEDCAPGYTGYPYCVPCPCDPLGSVNMDLCEADCQCKVGIDMLVNTG